MPLLALWTLWLIALLALGLVLWVAARWLPLLIFVRRIRPRHDFDAKPPPPEPDYDLPTSWAVRPERPGKSILVASGEPPAIAPEAALADVFFIHPTTYLSPAAWNAPLDDAKAKELVDEMVIPGQAAVFNACCRIFAPRYRQATVYSFLDGGSNGRRALELAYRDVRSSFEHYLAHNARDRPLFLASHSQGTVHAIRLLEELGEQIAERLVAAYLVGFAMPSDKLDTTLRRFPASTGPRSTGCMIAWDTYSRRGRGPAHRLDRGEHWYPDAGGGHWERRAYKKPLCVNPLTWTCDRGDAPEDLHRGAVEVVLRNPGAAWKAFFSREPTGLDACGLSALHPRQLSARCGDDGYLYISDPKLRSLRRGVTTGGNYHLLDYGLFHQDLRVNAQERLDEFLGRRGTIREQ